MTLMDLQCAEVPDLLLGSSRPVPRHFGEGAEVHEGSFATETHVVRGYPQPPIVTRLRIGDGFWMNRIVWRS